MALIVEDGTGLTNSQTYASAVLARSYATLRGITLPAAPADPAPDPVEVWLIQAMDYLNSLSFVGKRATATQALDWPRVLCWTWAPSAVALAADLISAQCQLVIELSNGVDLLPTTEGGAAGQFVVREKVDVIETQYSERLGTLNTPTLRKVNALLRDLVVNGSGTVRTVRV